MLSKQEVEKIRFFYKNQINKIVLKAIKNKKTKLDLLNVSIDDFDIINLVDLLQQYPTITEIKIGKSKITGKALEHFNKLDSLEILSISNSNIKDGIIYLKDNNTIKNLSLVNCDLDNRDLKDLEINSNLEYLDLSDNNLCNIDKDGYLLHVLTFNKNLRSLNLSFNNINDLDLTHILKAISKDNIYSIPNSLCSLNIQNNNLTASSGKIIFKFLNNNVSITYLNLANTNLGDKGIIEIARAFKVDDFALQYLNLSGCSIGSYGTKVLAKALSYNSVLNTLNLSNNSINNNSYFYSSGTKAIAMLLAKQDTISLSNIDLSANNIDTNNKHYKYIKKIIANSRVDKSCSLKNVTKLEFESEKATQALNYPKAAKSNPIFDFKQLHEKVEMIRKKPPVRLYRV
jgi:hypothetical protein